jgi:hypothetical protein
MINLVFSLKITVSMISRMESKINGEFLMKLFKRHIYVCPLMLATHLLGLFDFSFIGCGKG